MGTELARVRPPLSFYHTSVRNWPSCPHLRQIRIIQCLTLSNGGSNSVSMLDQVKGDRELSLDMRRPQFTDEESEAAMEARRVGRGSPLSYSLGSIATLLSTGTLLRVVSTEVPTQGRVCSFTECPGQHGQ